MKLQTKTFHTALAEVGKVIRGRTTLPAAACVKLSMTNDDRLQLEATNFDAWITRKVECAEGIEPVLVNHKKLSEIIGNVTTETLELSLRGSKLVIQGVGSSAIVSLNTLPVGEISMSVGDQGFKPLAVPPVDLADGLESVTSLADADDRTDCVIVALKPTTLQCAASTRGIMWGIFSRALICEDKKLVLPASMALLIVTDLRAKNCVVSVSDRIISVVSDIGSSAIKLSEKTGLPFERFAPSRAGLKGTLLDRETLRRFCNLASLFTPESVGPAVKVERAPGDDQVRVFCRGGEDEASEILNAPGEPLKFKLDARLVNACLSKTMADEVLVMQRPDCNAVFMEAGDLLFVLAEMRYEDMPEAAQKVEDK